MFVCWYVYGVWRDEKANPFGWCHSPLHDVTSDSNTIPVRMFVLYLLLTQLFLLLTQLFLLLTQLWFFQKPKDFPSWFSEYTHSVCRCIQFYTCIEKLHVFLWYDLHTCFLRFCPSHNFPNCLLTFGHLERMKSCMLHKTMRWAIWQMVRFTDCQLLNRISEPCIVLHLNGTVAPQGNLRSTPKATT